MRPSKPRFVAGDREVTRRIEQVRAMGEPKVRFGEFVARRDWIVSGLFLPMPTLLSHPILQFSKEHMSIWRPGQPFIARCLSGCTFSPNPECPAYLSDGSGCGIYASKPGTSDGWKAWGEVLLWGEVIETAWGYRAEKAIPYRINRRELLSTLVDACSTLTLGLLDRDEIPSAAESILKRLVEAYGLEVVDRWEE